MLPYTILGVAWLLAGLYIGSAKDCRPDPLTGEWRFLRWYEWAFFAVFGPLAVIVPLALCVAVFLAIGWALTEVFGQ